MEKYEMLPTEENLMKTLLKDTIGRNKDIVYFYNILQAQNFASTIALDGRWGSGKTFFVNQIKMLINALNPSSVMEDEVRESITTSLSLTDREDEYSSIAVFYDAWENDNDTDPIFSLIYEITKQLSVDFSLSDRSVLKTAGAIIEALSGHHVNEILEVLTSDDPFTKFQREKNTVERIKDFFSKLLEERGNRLVIFIDELDRCKPTFTVKLLEQIKHYIFDERITFVFSVNLEQLQQTIKHYYGADFDSCRYLDRFFDLRIAMPPADTDRFYNELEFESSYYVDIIAKRVIGIFNFELREITKFYSQVKAAVYKPTHENGRNDFVFPDEKGQQFILMIIVPLMIGLRIADVSKYEDFVNGKDVQPLKELFDTEKEFTFLAYMLNGDESFEKEEGKRLVTESDMIDKLYEAIFIKDYSGREYRTSMGQYWFSKESKKFAINASNMMTDYAMLN